MRLVAIGLTVVSMSAANAAVLLSSAQVSVRNTDLFPAIDSITERPAVDEFRRDWYSKHLIAMAEPPLPEGPGDTYRFLWLRSFHNPIAVRVVCLENACELTGLRTDGRGGYEPGSVVERTTRRLSDREAARLMEMLTGAHFWQPQPPDDRIGLDGAQWILEGRRGQAYHLWDVWSPETSGPLATFRELCLQLVHLSGLAVEASEVY